MHSFIVGTAGHIDHGKSSLVKALTGTDPDRLKEEKERGITIDLGFAHMNLSAEIVASFIDVPGHEKFVRHMVAGASGIDAVLLVIDSREGVKPQTREHFEICRLLGIRQGLIVLTKVDVAESNAVIATGSAARDLVKGSFLESAALVPVSAKTGLGLESLKRELHRLAEATAIRSQAGLVRLPVDRVFTLRGFGTVVTGTLGGGRIEVGDDLMILPSLKTARVRGLQVHGGSVEFAVAGERTALNLSGVLVDDLKRGDVLVRPGSLRSTRVAHVELQLLDRVALKPDSRVRIHVGSAEVGGRLRPSAMERTPGSGAVAEIRFESPIVLARHDRLIIRSPSPAATLGGARVLDPSPRPLRRKELEKLGSAWSETDGGALSRFIREAGPHGLSVESLGARFGLLAPQVRVLLANAPFALMLDGHPDVFIDKDALDRLQADVLSRLKAHHERDPLAKGMSKEEAKRSVFEGAAPGAFETVVRTLEEGGRITDSGEWLSLKAHRIQLSGPDEQARVLISEALKQAGLQGLALTNLHTQVGQAQKASENAVRVLVQENLAVRIGEGHLVSREAIEAFRSAARARFRSGTRLDVAEVKELTGLSRKYVIPLLEWLDRERVTRRVGAERIVL